MVCDYYIHLKSTMQRFHRLRLHKLYDSLCVSLSISTSHMYIQYFTWKKTKYALHRQFSTVLQSVRKISTLLKAE